MRSQKHRSFNLKSLSALLGVTAVLVLLALMIGLAQPVAAAGVIYVDVDAPGPINDGTTWGKAFTNVQDALAAWTSGDEIWVAEGRYFPDVGGAGSLGDQTASFLLSGNMKLYGGFDGTEGALGDRDPAAHVTVLSGDIDHLTNPDGVDGDGVTVSHLAIAGANSHHVVQFVNASNTALLDGFAVSGGDAVQTASSEFGGGIEIYDLVTSQIVIRNLRVQGNRAFSAGGGLYNLNTPMTLEDSKFIANSADDGDDQNGSSAEGGGAYVTNNTSGSVLQELQRVEFDANFAEEGGGLFTNLHNASGTGLTLNGSSFKNNTASLKGGGMLHAHGTPVLTNVAFLENKVIPPFLVLISPHWGGGGLALAGPGSQPTLNNITFAGNEARSGAAGCVPNDGLGGAVHVLDAAPIMNNVLFSGNYAQSVGGALFVHRPDVSSPGAMEVNNATFAGNFSEECGNGHVLYYTSSPQLLVHNSILWGNGAGGSNSIFTALPSLQFKNSIVQGCDYTLVPPFTSCGADGGGNLTDDPLFVDQTLFTAAPTTAGNNRLAIGSPAVDKGDDTLVKAGITTDLDNRPRFVNGDGIGGPTVDMGAYELPFACPDPASSVLRVDKDATGSNTGLTWTDALLTLQDALVLYNNCPGVDEIWVAEGIYYPDRGGYFGDPWATPLADRRQRSFVMTNDGSGGIDIYGGFAGTENSTAERGDPVNNVTVLSGDIEKNDVTNANSVALDPSGIVGSNSNHVLSENDPTCAPSGPSGCPLIDRFTVTGGDAWAGNDGSIAAEQGGGMWSLNGVTTLSSIRFQGNQATRGGGLHLGNISENLLVNIEFENNLARDGGGMAIVDESHAVLDTVTFKSNEAKAKGSVPILGNGGGLYIFSEGNVKTEFIGVEFLENVADDHGGGLYIDKHFGGTHLVTMNSVVFKSNKATGDGSANGIGGAMTTRGNSPQVDLGWFMGNEAEKGGAIANLEGANAMFFDSLVSGNLAQVVGGGMYNDASSPELTNITMASNRDAGNGGGMYNHTGSNPIIHNSVLWLNSRTIFNADTSTPVISYSLLQGCGPAGQPPTLDPACGSDAGGNIEGDPSDKIFVAPIDPSAAPSTAGDFHLDINSLAIDVGNNAYNDHYAALGGVEDSITPIAPRKLDGNGDGTVTIDMGAFEAPAAGRIIVKKETQPAGADEAFFYELTPPSGPVVNFVLQDGESFDSLNLSPGSYSVVETEDPEWYIYSATCDDQSDPSSIELQGGTTVTCTFVNRPKAIITESFTVSRVEEGKLSGEGSKACYWITLAADPGSGEEVVVNVGPPQNGQVTLDKTTVTMDSSNWDNLSTAIRSNFVCQRAVDDDVVDGGAQICRDGSSDMLGNGALIPNKECGDHKDFIPHSIASSTVVGYDSKTPIVRKAPNGQLTQPSTIDVLVQDNDKAGVSLTESFAVSDLDEDGTPVGKACYWVNLTSQPTAPVTVKMASSTVNVTPKEVTLDASNWNTLATNVTDNQVCMTPVNNNSIESGNFCAPKNSQIFGTGVDAGQVCGDYVGKVSHTVTSAGDADYNGTTDIVTNGPNFDNDPTTVDPLIRNDDVAALNTTPVIVNLLEGSSASYDVSLMAKPDGSVTVDNGREKATFNGNNWNQAKSFNLDAPENSTADGTRQLAIAHLVTSTDSNFQGLTSDPVQVTVVDNDSAGVLLSSAEVTVAEDGRNASYKVRLTSQPTGNVAVKPMPDSQAKVSPSALTFTPANWNKVQTVTVGAVDDAQAEAAGHAGAIDHQVSSSDGTYNNLVVSDVRVLIDDNDKADLLLSEADGLKVAEGGATGSYSLRLNSQPVSDVTVTMSDDGQLDFSPQTVHFTPGNWSQSQPVTIIGIDDGIDEGDSYPAAITHKVTSADAFYNGFQIDAVPVTVRDNDTAGVKISKSVLSAPTGGKATYTVELTSRPEQVVVIDLLANGDLEAAGQTCDDGEGSSSCLKIEVDGWDKPQTVTVRAKGPGRVEHQVVSSDGRYDGLSVQTVTVNAQYQIFMPVSSRK